MLQLPRRGLSAVYARFFQVFENSVAYRQSISDRVRCGLSLALMSLAMMFGATAHAVTITSFTPTSGPVGTSVTINGTGFVAPVTVQFNGAFSSAVTLVSSQQLTAQVPGSATTGRIVVKANGKKIDSNAIFVVVATVPNAPVAISVPATSISATIPVSWTPSSSGSAATYYELQRATSLSGPWVSLSANLTSTSYTDTVPGNGTYYYEVAACNAQGCSGFTVSSGVVVTLPPAPNPPISVTVPTSSTSANIPVSWTPSSSGSAATYYWLQRGPSASGPWTSINANITTTNYTDTVPAPGTYFYEVAACNGQGCSNFTVSANGVIVTGSAGVTLPPLPSPVTDTAPTHDATTGTMAGHAGTDGGASTYSVPIVVPPGRAGMQPSLSLSYNSRSGDGIAGMGWTISGLSSIHRCPQTLEQDGQALGVSYSGTDRLCLDGQRLVAVSGAYGQSGTQYRTEVDSFARITQIGGGLTGSAACFMVEQKDGRILHYGAVVSGTSCAASSANSRVQPAGAAATLSWLVEKIEDRVGNNQLYAYTNYGNGETLLSTVTYTGFGTSQGNRTVTFNYQPRTNITGVSDTSSSYLASGLTMQTKALQSITTAVAGAPARTYTPTYAASQYSARLLMATLQECAYQGGTYACHPATRFTYNDDVLNTTGNVATASLQGFGFSPSTTVENVPYRFSVIGDLDGDGTKDLLVSVVQSDGQHVYLAQMTADRQIHAGVDISGTGFAALPGLSSDLDGSGRSVMIKMPTSGTSMISFGVWNLGRGAIATSNPFTTVTSNIPFDANLVRSGQSVDVYAADMDGDGKTDLLVVEADSTCGANDAQGPQLGLFLYRNVTNGSLSATNPPSFSKQSAHLLCLTRTTVTHSGLPSTWYGPAIEHVADFDGDGLPDIYMVRTGSEASSGSFSGIWRTQWSGSNLTSTLIPNVLNCDNTSATSTTDECNWQNGYATHWMDVNGDGLEDFVVARPYQKQWQIRLNRGNGTLAPAIAVSAPTYAGLDAYSTGAFAPDGSPISNFRYATRLPTMDTDSDGKPDILIPSQTQGVHGFALKMCVVQNITIQSNNGEGCPIGTPTSAAPTPSSLLPVTLHCAVNVCPSDPGAGLNLPDNAAHADGEGPPKEWNNLPAYDAYGAMPPNGNPSAADVSVYHLAMLKFVQTAPSAFTAQIVETPFISRLGSNYGQAEDLFGDGLADLTTAVGCPNKSVTFGSPGDANYWTYPECSVVGTDSGVTYGPVTFPDGTANTAFVNNWVLYGNINQGVPVPGGSLAMRMMANRLAPMTIQSSPNAVSLGLSTPILPGLLDAAINGMGDTAAWAYAPLSTPGSQDGITLYSVPPTGGYSDSRHYYFQSSMPVVDGMAQSSGNGQIYTGFRSAVFGYAEAMYNHYGRGFTGFRQIIAETGDGTDTSGQHYRVTRTTTTYNQKFPLTGKVAEVQTAARDVEAGANNLVHDETYNYICTLGNRTACPQGDTLPTPTGTTVYAPVLDSQTVKSFDFGTGAQYAQVDTVNANGGASGWDAYGNLAYQTVTRADKGAPVYVSAHTTTTQNTFDYSQTGNWWLDKLTQSSITSSVTYGGAHALPSGASAPSQTVTTSYTWNSDRTPLTKTVQPGIVNQQSTTTYCYPGSASPCPAVSGSSYGLPSSVSVNAPDLNPTPLLSPTRMTSFTYTNNGTSASADGYFVLTAKNALNQITTTTHETNDGAVLTATDPNGVQIVTTYDPFGRATQIQHLSGAGAFESPVQIAYNSCLYGVTPGYCPSGYAEDGNELNAAYRITTVQAGYPTQVVWYDLLGREIKTAKRGYSGTFIETRTDYDDMGTVSDKFTPFNWGSSPQYFTSWTYDALNRPMVKIASASDMDSTHGNFVTGYTYSGRTTTITAHAVNPGSVSNLNVTMSRSQNVLGQYMQTTDAKSGVTNYWTDSQGHVAAMQDAEGNITTAQYNALGQRTQSSDPDQGTWKFTYDAFGELLTQTDARGVVTTVTNRDALGRTTQQQAVPPSPLPIAMANEVVQDTWSYDPANGIGELGSAQRRRGTSATPGSNPVTWQETYGYDTSARPSTIATTINEGGSVTLNSGMGYDSLGRPITHTYPDGLTVQTLYGPYGQSGGIANYTTGQIWYETTAEDAWGKPTTEKYADGTVGTIADYQSSGQEKSASWTLGGTTVDSLTYKYDSLGNLVSQNRVAGSQSNTETYSYDPLQRLLGTSRTGGSVSYFYSASGNLTSKSDFGGSYSYAGANGRSNGCGPHAVNGVALVAGGTYSYTCDANGNVYGGSTLNITYDADNHPRTASRNGNTVIWAYDANEGMAYESSSRGIRYFAPGGYEQVGTQGIHELGPIVVTRNGSTDTVTTTLRGRLGSTIDTIDAGFASSANARNYDAFGAARNGDMSVRANGTLNLNDTIHGFTKHEHADDVWLIHMGGRIYDYQLGRFLNVDPIIGNPLSSQSLNPYSYIGNNPLSGTDPTGYEACTGSHTDHGNDPGDCADQGVKTIWVNPPSSRSGSNGAARQGAHPQGNATQASDIGGDSNKYRNIGISPEVKTNNPEPGLYQVGVDPLQPAIVSLAHISVTAVANHATIFVNGILQSLMSAIGTGANHFAQIHGGNFHSFVLFYNPTKGPVRDSFETLQDIGASYFGAGYTDLAKDLGDIMLYGQRAGMSWDVIGHSQGGAILAAALEYAVGLAGEGSLSSMHLSFDGAPVHDAHAMSLASAAGIRAENVGIHAQHFDFVHYGLGFNSASPLRIAGSILSIPGLFGDPDHSQHTLPCGPPGATCATH